jgi:NADPH-dependent ferric siderophore reductase
MEAPQSEKTRRMRPRPLLAEVARVERLTPHMTRVVFTGEELAGFNLHGLAAHFKVNFPPVGQSKIVLPEWGPDGPILLDCQ